MSGDLHARRTVLTDDPILREVRQNRETYSLQFAGDIASMFADLRRREQERRESIGSVEVATAKTDNLGVAPE